MNNPFMHLLALDLEAFRKEFRNLLMKHHPDKGGSNELMKLLNEVREMFVNGTVRNARQARNEYEASDEYKGKPTSKVKADEYDGFMRDIINKLLEYDTNIELVIEVRGQWLWIGGETKKHIAKLKELKFLWSNNKGLWYWNGDAKKRFYGKPKSMEYIRTVYSGGNVDREKKGGLAKR